MLISRSRALIIRAICITFSLKDIQIGVITYVLLEIYSVNHVHSKIQVRIARNQLKKYTWPLTITITITTIKIT